jgi:hypothetical protein
MPPTPGALRALEAVAGMEGAVPCALYASDVPYEGPMPPADLSRGEVTATQVPAPPPPSASSIPPLPPPSHPCLRSPRRRGLA